MTKGCLNINCILFSILFHRAKIPNGVTYTNAVAFGKRYTAEEALDAGIVQKICKDTELEKNAIQMAKSLVSKGGYDRQSLQQMKTDLYHNVIKNVGAIQPYGNTYKDMSKL